MGRKSIACRGVRLNNLFIYARPLSLDGLYFIFPEVNFNA